VSLMAQQDIDPMAFPMTHEQFGITCIPGTVHLDCDFGGPMVISSQDAVVSTSQIYTMKLHLSKLKGRHSDVYCYLATAQQTRFAVTPLHTEDEFKLYNDTVSRGGEEWCPQAGKPIFHKMSAWWSSKADGKTIFYKLPEHLTAYHKKWVDRRNQSQSMIASEPQRQQHTRRIQSTHHIAQVLDPAPYNQPGVAQPIQVPPPLIRINSEWNEPGPSALPAAAILPNHPHSILEGLAQEIISGEADPLPASNHMPIAPAITFRTPILSISSDQPQTPTQYAWSAYNSEPGPAQGRWCGVCKEAGRDGYDCPGKSNRAKCKYNCKCHFGLILMICLTCSSQDSCNLY
jgi:hypothetical protein